MEKHRIASHSVLGLKPGVGFLLSRSPSVGLSVIRGFLTIAYDPNLPCEFS